MLVRVLNVNVELLKEEENTTDCCLQGVRHASVCSTAQAVESYDAATR